MVGEKPEKGGKWKMKNNCDICEYREIENLGNRIWT